MLKRKTAIYSEAAYLFGLVFLAFGTALMEKADFGMSMVVVPAYLLYLKLSQYLPFFTFGMAEYLFQALLLIALTAIMRKFKWSYLFSFVTAVLYGVVLDLCMMLVSRFGLDGTAFRLGCYFVGMLFGSLGVAFMFRSDIPAEAYEQFVKEISEKTKCPISKTKTIYDCVSCAAGIAMSFAFFGFGHFEGVKLGTVFCALINGFLIGRCGKMLEGAFEFRGRRWKRKPNGDA